MPQKMGKKKSPKGKASSPPSKDPSPLSDSQSPGSSSTPKALSHPNNDNDSAPPVCNCAEGGATRNELNPHSILEQRMAKLQKDLNKAQITLRNVLTGEKRDGQIRNLQQRESYLQRRLDAKTRELNEQLRNNSELSKRNEGLKDISREYMELFGYAMWEQSRLHDSLQDFDEDDEDDEEDEEGEEEDEENGEDVEVDDDSESAVSLPGSSLEEFTIDMGMGLTEITALDFGQLQKRTVG
ncbi:hypothetical protein IWX90DRAFT_474519 [Phyllosticta citrichinensis]|uniref:Uncharacterized protein n=1 Tax=Phyllosticta citrichinensis TaxID=1130410 RepID=A0ABR1Y7R6_9PEZI